VQRLLVVLSGLAFVSLGLPDGLLGVAWPSMRAFFGRDLDALGTLLVAATTGYVASSFASGRLYRYVNLGAILAVSCVVTGVALAGYAAAGHWLAVIALAVVLGLGGGAIDAALNTYAATNHGPRTLNWLHACYGIGAAIGPVIMTLVLGRGLPWQRGYALVASAQLALAGCFALTRRSWPRAGLSATKAPFADTATIRATMTQPAALLGIATFIAYAGVEASVGAWTYTLLTAGRGLAPIEAGAAVSVFWGGLTAGRLLAALGGALIDARRLLGASVYGVGLGTLVVWWAADPVTTIAGVATAGCACGPIFPTLVATTPARVGLEHAGNAVGFQIAFAAVGLSVLPGVVGLIADAAGVETLATLFVALALLLIAVYRVLERVAPVREIR
jgi:fucose permease